MPEAPEVQSVLDALKEPLQDRQVQSVECDHPKLCANESLADFAALLCGQHFRAFHRAGKWLVLELDQYELLVHLRMEGKLYVVDEPSEDPKIRKHIHLIVHLDDGRQLCFQDVRKFGRMYLYPKPENWRELPVLQQLGPDLLEAVPDIQAFKASLARRKLVIKQALLDQKLIAGIGNIYASEMLFEAGIHPDTPANTLSLEQLERLLQAGHAILQRSLANKGTTIRSFESTPDHTGGYQNQLQVYGRKGQPCPRCGTPLVLEKTGQRSTYLCPNCQKLSD